MDLNGALRGAKSGGGVECQLCDRPITGGARVVAVEVKVGLGILSKKVKREAHVSCAKEVVELLEEKIKEAEAL